ncbi:hypothetical protein NEMIN01_0507 [Nematocida minor]|uniref:uncharacterized protein n=1 Tax=Nematocida minor TaxID=1912983 RepID=UPI00221E5B6E|nr:uncharacterized protein NEMIN01_0507 [Nematocida minor]KAI5189444.1 hypothetical protein NEMIN01_0507 [Nematocida minor]
MKRILVAPSYTHAAETTKRSAPDVWQDSNYREEETKKEEEERIFKEIKRHLKRTNENMTIVKKTNFLKTTRILTDMTLYDSFIRVIHLVDTPAGIAPVEADYKDTPMFNSPRGIKKSKYTFKTEMTQSLINNSSVRIVSTIYAIEGRNTRNLYKYLDKSVSLIKRLSILDQLIKLSLSLNKKILDPNSIYIQDERSTNILYIPTERNTVSTTEYMMFVVSVLLNTYTVMERAIVVRELTMKAQGSINSEVYNILLLLHKGTASKDWASAYTEASEYIVKYMKIIQ